MTRVPDRQRIYDDIREKIAAGEYPPGSKLPTMRELVEVYGTSAEPVRFALARLEAEGWIEGHQGKGRYVTGREP